MGVRETFSEILSVCWQHRLLAAKYIAVPGVTFVATSLILEVGLAENAGTGASTSFLNILAIFVFPPFCVAWMRIVMLGPEAVKGRPLWTFGDAEWGYVGWNILISVLIVLIVGLMALLGLGFFGTLAAAGDALSSVLGVVGIIIIALLMNWLYCRWALTFPMTALRHTSSIGLAWSLSRNIGWTMAWCQVLTFLLAAASLLVVNTSVDLLFGTAAETETPSTGHAAVNSLLTALFVVATNWLLPTNFALAYKRVKYFETVEQTPEAPPTTQTPSATS
jgi:hypothetical protein